MMTTPVPPGACDWTIDTGCVADWDSYPPEVQERATALAVFVLDAFTGRQFDQCPVKTRPCGPRCAQPRGYVTYPAGGPAASDPGVWMSPYIVDGIWRNCGCGGGCACGAACEISLGTPVASIVNVMVDGLVLDPSAYTLQGPYLVRTDGGPCFPSCQDTGTPDTEDGTFSVTYRPGRALPVAGQVAAGLLAGQFAAACGSGPCTLPGQLQSLTRQGIDVEMVSPADVLAAGRTGIQEVDFFIQAVNPAGVAARPRVYSPDIKYGRRTL